MFAERTPAARGEAVVVAVVVRPAAKITVVAALLPLLEHWQLATAPTALNGTLIEFPFLIIANLQIALQRLFFESPPDASQDIAHNSFRLRFEFALQAQK